MFFKKQKPQQSTHREAPRRVIALVGEQGSGKSYFANQYARNYIANGRSAFIYNLGMPTDFAIAENFELLTFKETYQYLRDEKGADKEVLKIYKEDKPILFFKDKNGSIKTKNFGNIEPIQNFNSSFYGYAAKMHRQDEYTQRGFFAAWFNYISDSLLILDDFKNVLRWGLDDELTTLFSRANHTGIKHIDKDYKKGSDIIIIMHSLELINDQIFFYLTDIVLFKTLFEPDWNRTITDRPNREILKNMHNDLREEEEFCFSILNIKSRNYEIYNPIPFV